MDVGCSTGGFSDVLLKNGAKLVYAVDVGYGQFDWKLRNSKKIKLFERTNAKFLTKKLIPDSLDILVCDVSFISLIKAIDPVLDLLKKKYQIIVLIKPQFEVEKNLVGKGGIVRDPNIHQNVCKKIDNWFKTKLNPSFTKIIESPIKGQKGNKEFLIYIKN